MIIVVHKTNAHQKKKIKIGYLLHTFAFLSVFLFYLQIISTVTVIKRAKIKEKTKIKDTLSNFI